MDLPKDPFRVSKPDLPGLPPGTPTGVEMVAYKNTNLVVVLTPVRNGKPDHCVHGQSQCTGFCKGWVYLGHTTLDLLRTGEYRPLCIDCATAAGLQPQNAVGTVIDRTCGTENLN